MALQPSAAFPLHPIARAGLAMLMAAGFAAAATLPQAAQAQQVPAAAQQRQFEVPAGPLAAALAAFAADAGVSISAPPALVQGKRTAGLQGRYTVREALERLLAGAGLQADAAGQGGYVLRAADTADTAEMATAAGATLAEVRVTAQAERGTATEGTGSYTTQATAAATGLALSPRETPQSVSVVTRQQIEDQGLTSLGEALKQVTGLAATSSDSDRTDLHSRGFYIDSYQYDGVPTSAANDFFGTSNFDPILYDRIEIVRGATGLMSGAGNPGASVNLVRKRATSKEFTGAASLGFGSWNDRRGTLDISTPLTEDGRIRARLAGMLEARDSHLDRYHTDNRALLATVEADIAPSTTAYIGWTHQAKRPEGVTWGGLPMVFSDGTPTHWRRSFSIGADWTRWNTTSNTTYAGLEHQFGNGWSLKANASRLDSKYDSRLLYLLSEPDRITGEGLGAFPNFSRQALVQNSASVQATGPIELLGRRHEAVVGLSGNQSRYTYGNHAYTAAGIGNIFEWDGSYPEPAWGDFRPLGDDRTRQEALYGALRLSLTDALKLIVGGRQSRWKQTGLSAVREHDKFTPYAGLVHDLNAVYSVYASYTSIFQPQDYRSASGAYLDPVVGKSYEAGVKAGYLDGRLNASLAMFRIDQDNVAVLDGDQLVPGTPDHAYVGAKGVSSKGFEAELSGELAVGWQVSAGFSHTAAKDAGGSRLEPRRPRNQLHLFTSYRLPGAWHKLTLGGGLRWSSGTYAITTTSAGIDARRDQGSIAIADLMAAYAFTPRLSAQLNISNLFDKNYFDFAGSQIYYGTPRKAMLSMKYQF